jgi:hypothetical protein
VTRAEQDAATLERVREALEAAMWEALPICGTQGLKSLVAGAELGALMRWTAQLPRRPL